MNRYELLCTKAKELQDAKELAFKGDFYLVTEHVCKWKLRPSERKRITIEEDYTCVECFVCPECGEPLYKDIVWIPKMSDYRRFIKDDKEYNIIKTMASTLTAYGHEREQWLCAYMYVCHSRVWSSGCREWL